MMVEPTPTGHVESDANDDATSVGSRTSAFRPFEMNVFFQPESAAPVAEQVELMKEAHVANQRGDFALALSLFLLTPLFTELLFQRLHLLHSQQLPLPPRRHLLRVRCQGGGDFAVGQRARGSRWRLRLLSMSLCSLSFRFRF